MGRELLARRRGACCRASNKRLDQISGQPRPGAWPKLSPCILYCTVLYLISYRMQAVIDRRNEGTKNRHSVGSWRGRKRTFKHSRSRWQPWSGMLLRPLQSWCYSKVETGDFLQRSIGVCVAQKERHFGFDGGWGSHGQSPSR